jgi:hypothetical protein
MADLLRAILEQATTSGSRSTALRDLRWFAGTILSALVVALKFQAPGWILVCIMLLIGITSLIYLSAYVFFAIRSPDALRSEKFTLSKLAIERSVTGDNLAGFVDPAVDKHVLEIPTSTPKKEDA